ncbi:MAG: hypothetical protein ACRD19_04310 [Terriglobia bacterium]
MTLHYRPSRGHDRPAGGHRLHQRIPLLLCVILANLFQPGRLIASQGPGRNDKAFLEELSYRCFLFFWEQADPHTGLIPDRALVVGLPETGSVRNVANVAATGFGLTALCLAAKHRWITKEQARLPGETVVAPAACHLKLYHAPPEKRTFHLLLMFTYYGDNKCCGGGLRPPVFRRSESAAKEKVVTLICNPH